jgi:hypothetical protein
MRLIRYSILGLLLTCSTTQAQTINFNSSRYDMAVEIAKVKETAQYERFLTSHFPTGSLRTAARERGTAKLRKVTYEVFEHIGVKYLLAVYTARWNESANRMVLYQMNSARSGEEVWSSRSWRSNYYGNSISIMRSGTKTFFLFKEGGVMPGDYGIASIARVIRTKGKSYIQDMTPVNEQLEITANFPLRPLLGQNRRDGALCIRRGLSLSGRSAPACPRMALRAGAQPLQGSGTDA